MRFYQKIATAALVSVILLLFVGAIVRVTGAGMGCPDWPRCWGLLIPPTHVSQVDFETLPIEQFQRKAARMGRDPETITPASLAAEFNPRHVWTEFVNRLCSLPVGFLTLGTFVLSFTWRKTKPLVFYLSFASLFLVLANAWMGARVVFSGLSPGVLTIHLAMAMLLICTLTYCSWAGTSKPTKIRLRHDSQLGFVLPLLILVLTVLEGILRSPS